ncbi:DUF6471 domain-containing protein [uncultured Jannaschia sp.]|uniref:DUF6471 domain-containing protein n=1 Tax=uncultured Jannaschia sp. TaxID=293347 RepID=UPI00260CC1A6|nr:DUF6471 domain-containing protein [uncultured Jannaschia sp.]
MRDRQTRSSPPQAEPRRGNPLTREYEAHAKEIIRKGMRDKSVRVAELAERLRQIGVNISDGGMANKISRGGFSAAFLLQCMDVLGYTFSEQNK